MITLFNLRPKGLNVGNGMIFSAMKHFINETFGEAVNIISLPATAKYETHSNCGLTAKTIYEINQYGDGVIIGGGNLYENAELDVDLNALKALDVPLMLFSLSRGRIYNRKEVLTARTDTMPDSLLKALNDKAYLSLSRDIATDAYLKKIGCNKSIVGACPTIFLNSIKNKITDYSKYYSNTVIISVRSPNLMSIPVYRQIETYHNISKMVEYFKEEKGFDVKLLCHDIRDIGYAQSFKEVEFIYSDNVFDYLGILNSSKLVVTYRLHSFLPCLSLGTPTINISYDERAASLIETIGFKHWNINMFESSDVVDDVLLRYKNIESLKSEINKAKPVWDKYYDIMINGFSNFFEIVNNYRQ